MPYGYLGTAPNQIKKNSGVFSVSDINELKAEGSLGGSTQLIATQSAGNSAQTLDFSNCFTAEYEIYKIHWKNYVPTNDENTLRLRLKNSSGEITGGSAYSFAIQYLNSGGGEGENRSTGTDYLQIMGGGGSGTGENAEGDIYIYQPFDSSYYTYYTMNTTFVDQNATYNQFFGGGMYETADSVTGCVFRNISSGGTLGNINTCDISIYGMKEL